MTASIAKLKHMHGWNHMHLIACSVLNITPDNEIDKFFKLSRSISNFTDANNHFPRTQDILGFHIR